MPDVHLEVEIKAPPSRIWRALCVPAEVATWDSSVEAALDAPPDYPRPGQHIRWRCRSGLFRTLHDRPQKVLPEQKLRSLLRLGFVRYDETYTLTAIEAGTRLSLELDVTVPMPLVGPLLERLRAIEDARVGFEASLANLRRHCEAR